MKQKSTLLFLTFSILSMVVFAQTTPSLFEKADKQKMNLWVDSVYNKMSVEEKVGQLFMPIVESRDSWKTRIADYINIQKVGGLLFSKGTLAGQANMTNYAQSISKTPLFISLDGEWGLSMRLSDAPGFPRNMVMGAITNEEVLTLYGKEVARQCKEMGIHINFAPTIDVHSNPNNPVIGTRSFGESPENTARQGIAYARGLEENGVMAVAKHFPGHGDTSDDSHKTLPSIMHRKERLEKVELYPFREYVKAGLSGVMVGHLNVPALNTGGLPASISPAVIQGVLRNEMGFNGLAFTDAMAMKGVSNQYDVSVKALLAGNDVVLGVVNQEKEFNAVKKAVEEGIIPVSMLEEKVKKILSYKYILNAHTFKPINTRIVSQRVNSSQAAWVQRKIYDAAMTLVKNEKDLIPLKELDKKKIASIAMGVSFETPFQKQLKKYAAVRTFCVANPESVAQIEDQLKDFDVLIYSLHVNGLSDAAAFQQQIQRKNGIFVLFSAPYRLSSFSASVNAAKSVLIAHDTSDFAQISAAQAIFGGIGITGRLPVSVGEFKVNTGIETKKTRLAYSLPEEVGISSPKMDGIDRIALEGVRQKAYPGCQILIAKEGVVIYEKAFGNFDQGAGAKVTDETVYDLASVTKASATLPAIMKLYDNGEIRLQEPISRYVPETKNSNKAHINIRSLLFHESGITPFIPYYNSAIDPDSYTGPLFGKSSALYNVQFGGAWARTDYTFLPGLLSDKESSMYYLPVARDLYAGKAMRDKLLKDVIDTNLRTRGRYAYSCLNFMLLKEAVENLSKTDMDTYLKRIYFRKLGATTTTFQPLKYMSVDNIPATEDDPFFRKQRIRGYVHDEGAALFGGISGNAGLFSTANDLAKLYQMWLNGGEYGGERYLKEETVRLFTTTKSSVSRRGLGFDKPDSRNNKNGPCSPLTPIQVYGHTGFTGTCFWIDPTNNLIYIFLSNRVNPSRSPNRLSSLKIRERIQDEIYKAISH